MYGSSRLGIWSRNVNMDVLPTGGGTVALLGSAGIDTFNRGNKFFELANHLGNVLVTVSDRKIGQSPVNNLYTSFTADVVSATDYAPFGMQMVGRSFDAAGSTAYRYGFNEKENDNEVKGEGNQQDYGMRIYDPRLGKFLSVDPITSDYPFYTPYQFAGNKPIVAADLDGLEEHMKSLENAMKRQAQLLIQKANQNKAVVKPLNPGSQTWAQNWRDSKNFFFQMTYSMANGIYTLPQQLFSGITQQEYIENIGGGSYRSRGSGSEKQRFENFINGATAFLPSTPGTQAAKGLGFADDAMKLATQAGDDIAKKVPIIDDLVKEAQKLYPKKAGKIEKHHPFPKYMGGAEDQVLVPLDAAYHQLITNEFLKYWPKKLPNQVKTFPTLDQAKEIMEKVYRKFPLPGK
jgi:hypothetical protein